MRLENQSLRKEERLKSRKLIKSLFDSGKIIHQYPFKVLYSVKKNENKEHPAQIAVSVSKRNFKRAVDRNHIKRKIREAYRLNKQVFYEELTNSDQNLYFFVIYTAKADLEFTEIEIEMKNLLQKLQERLSQI